MGDPLKGNDGKIGQDYMRAIVGAALAQTARMGVKDLVNEMTNFNRYPNDRYTWDLRNPSGTLTGQSWNYDNQNYVNDIGPKTMYGFNKGMSTTTTMSKPKPRRYRQTYYHATDERNFRKKKYFGFKYKKW